VGEDMWIAQASSVDITSAHRLEKPVAPRSTHRTRPLLSRTSVWIISLLGKGFIVYLFVPFSISFCYRSTALRSNISLLPQAPYHRTSRHLSHTRRLRVRCRAPRYDQVKFYVSDTAFFLPLSPRGSSSGRAAFMFVPFFFSSIQFTLCVDYLCVDYLCLLFQTRIY